MKFACIDQTAADRLKLQERCLSAFESCRDSVGHLIAPDFVPISREELLLRNPAQKGRERYGAFIVGSAFGVEQCYQVCSELRELEEAPIFLVVPAENFSLRLLRRFERLSVKVLRTDEVDIRIVHEFMSCSQRHPQQVGGKIVSIVGVKGGVGATSITIGLAHAASALNKKAIVVDLSSAGVISHYLHSSRWHSADYRSLLVERLAPARTMLERFVEEAPCGVELLLPPAGGLEIRELWLRNQECFEITLSLLEMLREVYDLVIIDSAHAEGVLPFSVLYRSDVILYVAANEPASVHLLHEKLQERNDLPPDIRYVILLNLLADNALSSADVVDFLDARGIEDAVEVCSIPRDIRAGQWIGGGNTLYTEGGRRIQAVLRSLVSSIVNGSAVAESPIEKRGILSFLRKRQAESETLLALPAPVNTPLEESFVLGEEVPLQKDFSNNRGRADVLPRGYASPKPVNGSHGAGIERRVMGAGG